MPMSSSPACPRARGVRHPALVPNLRGLERALAAGAREVAVFASATESFARQNLNRSRSESLRSLAEVAGHARQAGIPVRGYVSMCFGDPWEGAVDQGEVVGVATQLLGHGLRRGVSRRHHRRGHPGSGGRAALPPRRCRGRQGTLAVHFHDTYGQALANTLAALRCGVTTVDAAAGGLGGCPFARSATGNLATEDLVFLLDGLGVATGVDLAALARTSLWLAQHLGRPAPAGWSEPWPRAWAHRGEDGG